MKPLILLLAFCVSSQGVLAGTLSKDQLIEDLTYLNAAVVDGHPVNYDPSVETNILPIIDQAEGLDETALSPEAFSRWIRQGIYRIGCIHTSISANPLIEKRDASAFIPLAAFIRGDELIISSCLDCAAVGQAIESINGVDKSGLIEPYRRYRASDGRTDAYAKARFHQASSELIASVLQHPAAFTVKTAQGEFTLQAATEPHRPERNLPTEGVLQSNASNHFFEVEGLAVLRVAEFKSSDTQFFRSVFKELDESGANELLLDLRQNTGGDRRAAVELTKHLVDAEFSYSILQPKLRSYRYLNGRGKFYLLLSKLKYNLAGFYRYRKTSLGGQFTYRYRPASRSPFRGRLHVITDGSTASASTMVTSWLKQFSDATFIGSQAGGGYNGNNGGSFPLITLPQSRIQIRFPAYRVVLDQNSKMRAGIVPDIAADQLTGLNEVIALIKAS